MISEAREHLAEYIKWILGRRAEAPGVATELAAIEAGWNEVLAALTPPPVAAPRDYFLGLGFDPGWAKTGIGAVAQHRDGSFVSAGVDLVLTSPDHTKKFQRQSVDDNRRLEVYFRAACAAIEKIRPDVIGVEQYTIFESNEYEELRKAAEAFVAFLGLKRGAKPIFSSPAELAQAFASGDLFKKFLELLGDLSKAVDAFRQQRGRGAAAKTYGVYTAVCCAAYLYRIPIFIFRPVDLKKAVCGRPKASKEEVAAALIPRIVGLQEKVESKVRQVKLREHVYDGAGMALLALTEFTKR